MPAKKKRTDPPLPDDWGTQVDDQYYDPQVLRRYSAQLAAAKADPEYRRKQTRSTQRNVGVAENEFNRASSNVDALGQMRQQALVGGYVPMTRATTQAAMAGRPGQSPYGEMSNWSNEQAVQQAYLRMLMSNLSAGSSGGVRRM